MRLALAAAAALFLALLAPHPALPQAPEPKADLADLQDEVMCPVCGVPLELAQEAPQAEAQRDFIRELIAQGKTKDEIKDALVAEYGEQVLAVPGSDGFDLAAWAVPIAAFVVAVIGVALAVRRWRRGRSSASPGSSGSPDPAADEALERDMARYEL